ncbi:MAG: hypothetical protein BJ554DRAFT_5140 [Olpidium bornovanus]|uniref:Uncharacterized protein n=1 Tax=Olpidium bornovanus TaxID=278681 RepID=A0A8H8DLP3_9FUNG|nr:MAG: hypothetical protein BJ554DRAFT_5140 [Olpidium bornovanus]
MWVRPQADRSMRLTGLEEPKNSASGHQGGISERDVVSRHRGRVPREGRVTSRGRFGWPAGGGGSGQRGEFVPTTTKSLRERQAGDFASNTTGC